MAAPRPHPPAITATASISTRAPSGRAATPTVARAGAVIAGPLYDEEGMVVADCDLRRGLHAKRSFDVVGHYGRTDVLAPERTRAGVDADRRGDAA